MQTPEPFDLEAVYDDQIAPLVSKLIEICQANGMPMIASFVYRRDSRGELDLCTTSIPVEGRTPACYGAAVHAVLHGDTGTAAIVIHTPPTA